MATDRALTDATNVVLDATVKGKQQATQGGSPVMASAIKASVFLPIIYLVAAAFSVCTRVACPAHQP